jgi:hypothetical protein
VTKTKLTAKEKRKTKRIEKKLTTKICEKTDSFGNCFCPHCGVLITLAPNLEITKQTHKCEICNKNFVVTEDIAKLVVERKARFNGILQKLQSIPYDKIDVVEVGIDRNCDINEVALLCKYFQCSIADLAGRVKSLLGKK